MSMWTLRDGRPDDAALLAQFWRDRYVETFAQLYRPQDLAAFLAASYALDRQYAELLDQNSAHRLAFAPDGALVAACGVGALKLPIDPGATLSYELHRLYLTPAAQGSGLADKLMTWALAQAQARNAGRMYLGVYSENHRAKKFYSRWGFVRVGGYDYVVGEAIDAEDIMMRSLV